MINALTSRYPAAGTITGNAGIMILLAASCAVLYLPGLDALSLYNEEPRRALIAKTMMASGDYIVPRLSGEIYLAKPPLFNWLIAAFSAFSDGISAFSARLPSVVSLALLSLFLFYAGRGVLSRRARLFAALGVLVSPELMAKAILAEIELVFTLLVTVSIWSWFFAWQRGRRGLTLWTPALVFAALGVLAKGPPGLVFFYLSVVPWLLWRRQARELVSVGHGFALVLAVGLCLLWVGAIAQAVGADALWATIEKEMINRGSGKPIVEILQHALSYPIKLLLAILPFSLPLLLLLKQDRRAQLSRQHRDIITFALLACAVNLVIYLTRDAAVRYFLPMLPTLIVAAAVCLDSACSRADSQPRWLLTGALALAGLAVGLYMLARVLPLMGWGWTSAWPAAVAAVIIVLSLSACLGIWRWRGGRGYAAIVGWFFLAGVMLRVIQIDIVLGDKAERMRNGANAPQVMNAVADRVKEIGMPLTVRGFLPYELWFYAQDGLLQPEPLASEDSVGELRFDWQRRDYAPASPLLRPLAPIDYRFMDHSGKLLIHVRR